MWFFVSSFQNCAGRTIVLTEFGKGNMHVLQGTPVPVVPTSATEVSKKSSYSVLMDSSGSRWPTPQICLASCLKWQRGLLSPICFRLCPCSSWMWAILPFFGKMRHHQFEILRFSCKPVCIAGKTRHPTIFAGETWHPWILSRFSYKPI